MTEQALKYCNRYGIDTDKLPKHVAVIMDGNGRWAQQRGLPRQDGHVEGVATVRRITEEASRLGISYLTLYTFSTENWNRPDDEVEALMQLISIAIKRETPDLIKNNVRLTMIGDYMRIPQEPRTRLQECFDATSHCTGLNLCLAISYSSHWEITEATRRIANLVKTGTIDPDSITDNTLIKNLATAHMPDPDLLIRTGGDTRLSNYLLWQLAYTELSFTDTFWPDFSSEEFRAIISSYQTRQRRYGLTGAQVAGSES